MKRNIELSISNVIGGERNAWGEQDNGSQLACKADLRAVAAYLQAMSEEPIDGKVTIGKLTVEIHVGRCSECRGSGRKWRGGEGNTCPKCKGSGREPEVEPAKFTCPVETCDAFGIETPGNYERLCHFCKTPLVQRTP